MAVGTVDGVGVDDVVSGKMANGVSDCDGKATGPALRLSIGNAVGVAFVKVVGAGIGDTAGGDVSGDGGVIYFAVLAIVTP
jgi:hypothetical protein